MDERQLLAVRALDAVAFAEVLAVIDPDWGSTTSPLADGHLVLCGRGLYVNRALGAGIDRPLGDTDVATIVEASRSAGVTPAVEVTPHTDPGTVVRLAAHGFAHDPSGDVTALTRPTGAPLPDAPDDVLIDPVRDHVDLVRWQETSALGWGHVTEDARRAADAFARAAFEIDGDGMIVAFDAGDGRPLGCASTTVRDGLATLGGMSTVPAERRRGVQAALLRYRLDRAAALGCTLAASTAVTGGASERNLLRRGFIPRFVVQTWSLASPG